MIGDCPQKDRHYRAIEKRKQRSAGDYCQNDHVPEARTILHYVGT
jgi:hypothetical protein